MNAMPEADVRAELEPGTPPIVLLKGIAKYFPGVVANQDVDLDVMPGEIHALLGENGAGKSTLMNILTGIYQPDAGEIIIDGYARTFASPMDAIAAGIGMVHQHFKLVKAFTVAENIHLGWEKTPRRITSQELERRTAELGRALNLEVRPGAHVGDLSTGEQQRVEILRVLARNARVLILDEPTAVLTPAEAGELFKALKEFVARGNAVVFISHKLDEVLEISDRITVLRGGRKVTTERTADCDEKMLAKLMVGREIVLSDLRGRAPGAAPVSSEPVLSLRDVTAFDGLGNRVLGNVSLDVHAGEILGIAGVAGNGQKELCQVLTGMRQLASGQVLVGGEDFSAAGAGDFAAFGVGHIPEDRLHSGLAPALSVTDNAVIREYGKPPVSNGGFYRPGAATALARSIADAASVQVPDFSMPVRNLSGGNQQRLVARREMRIASKVLIAAYPSRGLDVGAINTMMRYFVELRDAGVGVLLVSEELEELLNLSDRIAVMFHGEVMGVVKTAETNIEAIGLMMGGQRLAAADMAGA
ncbi:nucleoside ABC transporter ATP-binding protein [Mesorhizobium australicum]|uniref:Nucleoside ABC transporter ATP-binding protein n=2 Tax=Mesorhizobium australicum TaxID=536018 RepID=A0A1X7PR74_9HYPH|nr:ABC transporter ATP-binding protein [Mesorhizobium australicum]SMH53608.1 nucleoside ABC transporter ATP-binding protein [Mesorhizobium australicum]